MSANLDEIMEFVIQVVSVVEIQEQRIADLTKDNVGLNNALQFMMSEIDRLSSQQVKDRIHLDRLVLHFNPPSRNDPHG